MVYCGQPSKSCRQCRKRNIKCDKKIPSCGQCARASLTCPGYHNPQNLTFRDETTTVVRKAFEEDYPPLLPHVVYSLEDRAKRLFISHHVFGDSPVLHYMKTFWPPSPNDKYFTFAIRAVSLAYLSSEVRSPDVLQQARKTYGSALALTNKALHSQDIALKNNTLLTVLLLDLFENLTNDEPTSTASATKHLDGALALLKLRGNAQFQDTVSLSMFQHLSSNLIPSCLERGIAIPKVYLRFRSQAARFVDTNNPDWRLSDLMIQLAKLRASLKDIKPASTQAIATAQYLDLEFLDISNAMPQSSDLETRSSQSPSSENSDNRPSQTVDRQRNLRLVRTLLDETLRKLSPDPA